ncbi:MAG: hypothetical protein SFY66_02810 [Oculatellaceae cyanobacterium bins.114]|nr:hypothetical protein [Oculatellaceae cyanobacterium bins.114]
MAKNWAIAGIKDSSVNAIVNEGGDRWLEESEQHESIEGLSINCHKSYFKQNLSFVP